MKETGFQHVGAVQRYADIHVPMVGTNESALGLHQTLSVAQDVSSHDGFDESVSLSLDGSTGIGIGEGGRSIVIPMIWTSESTCELCNKLCVVQGRWWRWWWASYDAVLEGTVSMCRDFGFEKTRERIPRAHLLRCFERDGFSSDQTRDHARVAWSLLLGLLQTVCYLYVGARSIVFIDRMFLGRTPPVLLPRSLVEPPILPTAASSNGSEQKSGASTDAAAPVTAKEDTDHASSSMNAAGPATVPDDTEGASEKKPAPTIATVDNAEGASPSSAVTAPPTVPEHTEGASEKKSAPTNAMVDNAEGAPPSSAVAPFPTLGGSLRVCNR